MNPEENKKTRSNVNAIDNAEKHLKNYVKNYIKKEKGKDPFSGEPIGGFNASLERALKTYPASGGSALKHMETFIKRGPYDDFNDFTKSFEKEFIRQDREARLNKRAGHVKKSTGGKITPKRQSGHNRLY